MPSSQIVRDVRTLIQNKLLPALPSRWQAQFSFGLQAYALNEFHSAAGNARQVVANPNTAVSKSERLLANQNLAMQLGTVFDGLGLVRPSSYVNFDHSDMNGLTAFVGARQTRQGRALPCCVAVTYSEHLCARDDAPAREKQLRWNQQAARQQQCFTGHVIDTLQDFHDRLGFWPKLVFDRWFANESLVTHLQAEGATFYIRLKAGRYVEYQGKRVPVDQLPDKNSQITLFGLRLRTVRSPKSRRATEPWYILTNDFSSSRSKVIRIYYHRFEIEEDFKDLKHILGLKRTRLNNPNSLVIILWLMALGMALLYLAAKPVVQSAQESHPKKQRSWFRIAFETWQRAIRAELQLTG
jgi:Transposase DDE domain